jgi:peptide/nickel transport system ATP-binding protein
VILQAQNLTLTLRTKHETIPVLRDISFALAPGRILGLVGESGAGKSMIGRVVAGLLPPGFAITAGTLNFDNTDLTTHPNRRALLGDDIAFIPQEPMTALNPVHTIGHQLEEHLARLGIPAGDRRDHAIAALESVHLPTPEALLARYPHQISGGQCQRVLIAMAFASRPKLVIADEPTTALDVSVQARIIALMRELQSQNNTAVVFITHDLRLAKSICDDIAVLYAGRIIEQGPVAEVFAREGHPYTRCLHLANPPLTGPSRALLALPDQMPGLRALTTLQGCVFAPRCPVATPDCETHSPVLTQFAPSHHVACLHPTRTANILPPTTPTHPPTTPGPEILKLDSLSKTFTNGPPWRRRHTKAVQHASLTIHEGEFLAIVGESGSGKSTIGRLVVGLETATSGEITLANKNVTHPSEATRQHRIANVQMVFQDPQSALNPRQRINAIITQALEAAGRPKAERQARARDLLAEMALAPEIGARVPSQLSGGQRQRVNIARALCTVPRLLVADEIVSGLDVSIQAQLLTLLARLRQDHNFALLFITHDLSVVRHLCDRVVVMHQGEIVESGPVSDVFAAPSHPYTQSLLAAVPEDLDQ